MERRSLIVSRSASTVPIGGASISGAAMGWLAVSLSDLRGWGMVSARRGGIEGELPGWRHHRRSLSGLAGRSEQTMTTGHLLKGSEVTVSRWEFQLFEVDST